MARRATTLRELEIQRLTVDFGTLDFELFASALGPDGTQNGVRIAGSATTHLGLQRAPTALDRWLVSEAVVTPTNVFWGGATEASTLEVRASNIAVGWQGALGPNAWAQASSPPPSLTGAHRLAASAERLMQEPARVIQLVLTGRPLVANIYVRAGDASRPLLRVSVVAPGTVALATNGGAASAGIMALNDGLAFTSTEASLHARGAIAPTVHWSPRAGSRQTLRNEDG